MKTVNKSYKPGSRVIVLWGVDGARKGTIVEVWGTATKPTQVRVRLDPFAPGEDSPVLLLNPSVVNLAS